MATINLNKHVFKGHRTLLGAKYVTYGELELSTRYDIFPKSKSGFDWGSTGSGAIQLAFSVLYQLSDADVATRLYTKFTNDIIKNLNSRDWLLTANDVLEWIEKYDEKPQESTTETEVSVEAVQPAKKKKPKTNVVKSVCKELNITQKHLAEILEVPEGTVSSWAVKNEIPRLGKKAIEFYKISTKNQKIVDSYKNFIQLLDVS
jgi:DNA-binding transcriptional regulator YiaG